MEIQSAWVDKLYFGGPCSSNPYFTYDTTNNTILVNSGGNGNNDPVTPVPFQNLIRIDNTEIVFGTGLTGKGITSSDFFTFEQTCMNLNHGFSNSLHCSTKRSAIIGGRNNIVTQCSYNSVIIGSENSIITGATSPSQCLGSQWWVNNSFIGGGTTNTICRSTESAIIGGNANVIWHNGPSGNFTSHNAILGGKSNKIETYTFYGAILGGQCNCLSCRNCGSSIIGGSCNRVFNQGWLNGLNSGINNSAILAGSCNSLEHWRADNGHRFSTIIGGEKNKIGCASVDYQNSLPNRSASILGGCCNTVMFTSHHSAIIGGNNNRINNSVDSAIIGGNNNSLCNSNSSLIIGTKNKSYIGLTDTVVMPKIVALGASGDSNMKLGVSEPTNPTNGDLWYDGTNIWFRTNGINYRLTMAQ